MFPGMNSRQAQQMMRKMGITQKELEASQVIIKLVDRQIVLDGPQVSKMNMMGQETYQVVGVSREEPLGGEEESSEVEINEEDVKTVMSQAEVSKDVAIKAIEDANGDLAEAILNLQE